jgi:hypothetical protein
MQGDALRQFRAWQDTYERNALLDVKYQYSSKIWTVVWTIGCDLLYVSYEYLLSKTTTVSRWRPKTPNYMETNLHLCFTNYPSFLLRKPMYFNIIINKPIVDIKQKFRQPKCKPTLQLYPHQFIVYLKEYQPIKEKIPRVKP